MNYFSSDYIYILKTGFETNWSLALIYILPSLLILSLMVLAITGLYVLSTETTNDKDDRYSFRAAQAGIFGMVVCAFSIPIFIFLFVLTLPEMGMIKFNK
jgi:uncharacterized membrane protein